MLVDHAQERLIQAVVYFAHTTRKLGKTKLYKLLYFLDFQHFRDTGHAVTHLNYYAWKMGPVPRALHEQMGDGSAEELFRGKVAFGTKKVGDGEMLTVSPLVAFDPTHFTRRQLRLLDELSARYQDADAAEMIEATHLENLPWHQVWEVEKRKQAEISYLLAVRRQETEAIGSAHADRMEIIKVFGSQMLPGHVLLHKNFVFTDGQSAQKYLVVLGRDKRSLIVAKTTSKGAHYRNDHGCQSGNRFPAYLLTRGCCFFPLNTWVCLSEFYELDYASAEREIVSGTVYRAGTLEPEIIRSIQVCAVECQDITQAHEAMIRTCFVPVEK